MEQVAFAHTGTSICEDVPRINCGPVTRYPTRVRLASSHEEEAVMDLCRELHAENGIFGLSEDKVRGILRRAFTHQGGILGVIGAPGHIRAMIYVLITNAWYTSEHHLEELFCWVHPDHRNSDYSKLLIEFAKDCSDRISVEMGSKCPLIMGILTGKRMAAKVRLYRRFFGIPVGAYFAHNVCWPQAEPSEEDFWRLPSMAKWLRRHSTGNERKMAS